MKRVFVFIMVIVIGIMMIGLSSADTAKDYKDMEDYMDKNESVYVSFERKEINRMLLDEGEDATVEFIRTSLIGLGDTENGMYLPIGENDEFSKVLILIYDISENNLPKEDRTILRSVILEWV